MNVSTFVAPPGLEPGTSSLSARCANQLRQGAPLYY